MGEKTFIFLWFYGGFVLALVFLLLATVIRSSFSLKIFCVLVAFGGLIYEGGCFAAASGFGKATGNGGGVDDATSSLLGIGSLVGVIWSILILFRAVEKKNEEQTSHKDPPESGQ